MFSIRQMAVTNRVLWLCNIVLVITLTFTNADRKMAQPPGQDHEPTNRSTDVLSPSQSDPKQNQISFQDLPDNYKKLFMSVEDLNNKTDTFLASEAGKNSQLVYNRDTLEVTDAHLEPLASRLRLTLVPDTWKSMTYIQGCCPSLDYWSADKYLYNINGIKRKLAQFPPMFQYIFHSNCSLQDYGENGHCIQGYVMMYLAVFDYHYYPPITFDLFNVPSYCKCLHY